MLRHTDVLILTVPGFFNVNLSADYLIFIKFILIVMQFVHCNFSGFRHSYFQYIFKS